MSPVGPHHAYPQTKYPLPENSTTGLREESELLCPVAPCTPGPREGMGPRLLLLVGGTEDCRPTVQLRGREESSHNGPLDLGPLCDLDHREREKRRRRVVEDACDSGRGR